MCMLRRKARRGWDMGPLKASRQRVKTLFNYFF